MPILDNKLNVGIVIVAVLAAVVVVAVMLLGRAPEGSQSGGQGSQAALRSGMAAPDFSLQDTNGTAVALAGYRGKQQVLVYAHEGLACAPCIEQMATLEQLKPELAKLNVTPLSVSPEAPAQQRPTVDQYQLTYPVLSHAGTSMTKDYDLYRFSMGHGDKPGHTFILVDVDGTVKWRKDYWPGVGMSVPGGTMFVEKPELLDTIKRAVGSP